MMDDIQHQIGSPVPRYKYGIGAPIPCFQVHVPYVSLTSARPGAAPRRAGAGRLPGNQVYMYRSLSLTSARTTRA